MPSDPKAQEGAIAIPEDLREQYDLHKKWLAIPWHERPRGTASVEAILRENAVNDIERIAALTQRAELAESRVKAADQRKRTLIEANCSRCKRGDRLFIEPSTGFYTHSLGGNYCSAHQLHNILGSDEADAARAADSAPVGGKEAER